MVRLHTALIAPLLLATVACGGDPSWDDPAAIGDEAPLVVPDAVDVDTDLGGAEADNAAGDGAPYFVVDAAGPMVVLAHDTEPSWSLGEPRIVGGERDPERYAPVSVERAAATAQLPERVLGLSGSHVVLFGAAGERCTAALGEPRLLRRLDPFDYSASWNQRDDGRGGAPAASDAREAWDLASDAELLVAPAEVLDGDCSDARYALPADAPRPRVFALVEAPSVDSAFDEALAAFRALPEHGRIQLELERWHADVAGAGAPAPAGNWEAGTGTEPELRAFRDAAGTELIGVHASTWGGCGDFDATLWALFRDTGAGLELVGASRVRRFPDHLLDVGSDGYLEAFSGDDFSAATPLGTVRRSVEVPLHGCPC